MPEEPKLLTCQLRASSTIPEPCKVNRRHTGQDLQRTVPRSTVASSSQWQETVGCRAVYLASFTITEVTDKILNWSYVHGFMKMTRDGRKPGQGAMIRYTEQSKASLSTHKKAQDSHPASLKQLACVYSQLKMFSFIYPYHRLLFLRKGHKITGFEMPSISILTAFMSQYTIMYFVILQNLKKFKE